MRYADALQPARTNPWLRRRGPRVLLNRGMDRKDKASFGASEVGRIRIALGPIACGYDGGQAGE